MIEIKVKILGSGELSLTQLYNLLSMPRSPDATGESQLGVLDKLMTPTLFFWGGGGFRSTNCQGY